MSDIVPAWNQALVDEIDANIAEEIPKGVNLWKPGYRWGQHLMWCNGHSILRHYPELREYEPKRGNPQLAEGGGGSANYSTVAASTGYERRRIKEWVTVAKEGGLTEETFAEYVDTKAENAWAKYLEKRYNQNALPPPDVTLPDGKYSVIYADPPWEYQNSGFEMSAAKHFPTMTTEHICDLEVPATDDAVCFMWVTNPLLPDGLQVLGAWGFEYKTNLVWVKDRHTAGFYVYGQHELLLIGVRGSGMLPIEEAKPKSVITGANDIHSKKPDSVYAMIDAMYPQGKRIEMFARQRWEGWEAWGNEI